MPRAPFRAKHVALGELFLHSFVSALPQSCRRAELPLRSHLDKRPGIGEFVGLFLAAARRQLGSIGNGDALWFAYNDNDKPNYGHGTPCCTNVCNRTSCSILSIQTQQTTNQDPTQLIHCRMPALQHFVRTLVKSYRCCASKGSAKPACNSFEYILYNVFWHINGVPIPKLAQTPSQNSSTIHHLHTETSRHHLHLYIC